MATPFPLRLRGALGTVGWSVVTLAKADAAPTEPAALIAETR